MEQKCEYIDQHETSELAKGVLTAQAIAECVRQVDPNLGGREVHQLVMRVRAQVECFSFCKRALLFFCLRMCAWHLLFMNCICFVMIFNGSRPPRLGFATRRGLRNNRPSGRTLVASFSVRNQLLVLGIVFIQNKVPRKAHIRGPTAWDLSLSLRRGSSRRAWLRITPSPWISSWPTCRRAC